MAMTWFNMIIQGLKETVYMTLASTFLSYLFGLPLGIILTITDQGHIMPNKIINNILGTIINLARSIPFLILMVAVLPFTRFLLGTTIGSTATIVPLVIGAIPFVARMVESSLKEIDTGVIEAAQSMGASPYQIVFKVMIPESYPSLVNGSVITTTTILGYSAMAGVIGGGGLGDLAIRYGYHRYQTGIMLITILILIILVQIIQILGTFWSKKINHKKNLWKSGGI